MIADKDRSGWFGASDVSYMVGNTATKSFARWWLEKLGVSKNDYTNAAMRAGTHFEHRILDSLEISIEKDRQILIPELRLRVNLDGCTEDTIYEVKTYNRKKGFVLSKKYRQQVCVQMYATRISRYAFLHIWQRLQGG